MKISEEFINDYIDMLIDSLRYINDSKIITDYFSNLDKSIENYRKNFMTQLRNFNFQDESPSLINTFSLRYKEYFYKRDKLEGKKFENISNIKEDKEICEKKFNLSMIHKKRKKVEDRKNKEKCIAPEYKESKFYDELTNFTSYEKTQNNSFNLFSFTEEACNENQHSKILDGFDKKSIGSDLYLNDEKLELNENPFIQSNSNTDSPLQYFTEQNFTPKFKTNLCFNGKQNNIIYPFNQFALNNTISKNIPQIHNREYNFYSPKSEEPNIKITSINLSPKDKIGDPVQINNIYINQNLTISKEKYYCSNFEEIIKDFQKNLSKKLKVFMEFINEQFKGLINDKIINKVEINKDNVKETLIISIIYEKKANFLTYETKYRFEESLEKAQISISTLPITSEYVKCLKSDDH